MPWRMRASLSLGPKGRHSSMPPYGLGFCRVKNPDLTVWANIISPFGLLGRRTDRGRNCGAGVRPRPPLPHALIKLKTSLTPELPHQILSLARLPIRHVRMAQRSNHCASHPRRQSTAPRSSTPTSIRLLLSQRHVQWCIGIAVVSQLRFRAENMHYENSTWLEGQRGKETRVRVVPAPGPRGYPKTMIVYSNWHWKVPREELLPYHELRRVEVKGDFFSPVMRDQDWAFADLSYVDLSHAIAEGVRLNSASLRGAKLGGNMRNAEFWGADLRDAKFENILLEGAEFTAARLRHTDFKHAVLFGAQLANADLTSANLEGAQMSRCLCWGTVFRKACLDNVDAVRCLFRQCSFDEALLRSANFEGSDFSQSSFRDARLIRSKFGGANFGQARFDAATVQGCLFVASEPSGSKPTAPLPEFKPGFNIKNPTPPRADPGDVQSVYSELKADAGCYHGWAKFDGAIFNSTVISLESHPHRSLLLNCLADASASHATFVDPVFGREVRDEAWVRAWRASKNPPKDWSMLADARRGTKLVAATTRRLWRQKNPWLPLTLLKVVWRQLSNRVLAGVIWDWLWRVSSDYGRDVKRWVLWSCGLILMYGFVYQLVWLCSGPSVISWEGNSTWLAPYFFSVGCFTSLGLTGQQSAAKTVIVQLLVLSEFALGYLMLGGLLAIFSNKLARRND